MNEGPSAPRRGIPMRLDVQHASDLASTSAGLAAVAVTCPFDRLAGDLGLPTAAADRLVAEARRVGFDGKLGSSVVVSGEGDTPWVALVGAGASPKATDYRRVASKAVELARTARVGSVALTGIASADRARYAAEGLALTGYAFDRHKTPPKDEKTPKLVRARVVCDAEFAGAIATGLDVAEGIMLGRDLANEHPGACTPAFLADECVALAERHGFEITVREADQLEAEGFNLIMAVGRGSAVQPRLVHMIWRPEGEVEKTVALVGKGVTYDAGGYSIKVSPHQVNMHLDMGGAAAVIGAAEAIGRLKPEGVCVHFIVPAVENLVSGNAYKVMEIVKGYGGTTVEVLNTDAEGRLILADALSYALEHEPDEIIDLATLTGACVVALGQETAAVYANDDGFGERFLTAAQDCDESMWRMPLTERIEKQLESAVADTKNIGSRWGGSISAALFLQKFVGDSTWIHVDLAGPAMADSPWEYINKGGTGFGVAALTEYVVQQSR